jgi:hypothetical protein
MRHFDRGYDARLDGRRAWAPMTGPWPPELTARVLAHHMALIPTLTLFEFEAKKFGEPADESKNDMDAAVQQVQAYSKAGGQILFGTDTDAYDTTEEYRQLCSTLDWFWWRWTVTLRRISLHSPMCPRRCEPGARYTRRRPRRRTSVSPPRVILLHAQPSDPNPLRRRER